MNKQELIERGKELKKRWRNSTPKERAKIWKALPAKEKQKYVCSKDGTLLFDYKPIN